MEIWKDIPEYEGMYQASSLGRIKSVKRVIVRKNGIFFTVKETILKQGNNYGYKTCSLFKEGKGKTYNCSQLVAMAFLNHKPCGFKIVVDHINNIKTDNSIENLQLISNRENTTKDLFRKKSTSKYIGVSFDKSRNKWISYFRYGKKRIFLGRFKNEIDAHLAYEKKLNETK